MAKIKKTDNKYWWECGEMGTSCAAGENVKWHWHFGKHKVPQKVRELAYGPIILLLFVTQEKWKYTST